MLMIARKLPLILLLIMVIVSAGSLIQLKPVSATFPGANGKIVFARNIGTTTDQWEIFTVNPDGSGLAQLTFTGENDDPRWSADGTKIVFSSGRTGDWAIWIMNADGSGQNQITHPNNPDEDTYPAFSPDGSKIVFRRFDGAGTNIWVINVDGSNQHQLTNNGHDERPVWSPDGSKIAFVSTVFGPHSHIFVMNPDGSGQTDISKEPSVDDYYPEWSPDGRMIAFQMIFSQAGEREIWVMNAADGSGRKQLSNPVTFADNYPAWSPDGTKIAFVRGLDSVWVMNAADGSNPVDITQSQPHSDTDWAPNWQPLFGNPVGGVVMPTSKLEIVAPFAALAGLLLAVSAVVAVKKRRD